MCSTIGSPLEEQIGRLKAQAARDRASALDYATRYGKLLGDVDVLTSKANRDARALEALKLWKRRAVTRMNGLHDDLLERETIDGERGGDGTGMDAARCKELRERLGRFLDDRDEE